MIRKQLQITEKQNGLLKEKAYKEDCSEAEITRRALDQYFKNQKEEKEMFSIDFGKFDDNRNFDWEEIRKVMQPFEGFSGNLGDITYDTKEEAEKVLEQIKPYVDSNIVKIVEDD